jgi:carbon-monoxide dehydrogenase medium subunit
VTIAAKFDYVRPETLEEAISILAIHPGEARVLAGGTDLVAWLRDGLVAPHLLVDIKRIGELGEIAGEEDAISIGSLATFTDIVASPLVAERVPMLVEAARAVGSTGIRNRATMVGNICSAVPSCDAGPALLSYGGFVEVVGQDGYTRIPIDEWFKGPRQTALDRTEIVTRVVIARPSRSHGAAYLRLSRYRGEDLAQASVAVVVTEDRTYRIAFGAVASTPKRARSIEQLLEGQDLDDRLEAEAIALVLDEISPITDMRATKEYRLRMSQVMLARGLRAAAARLAGDGPPYGSELM